MNIESKDLLKTVDIGLALSGGGVRAIAFHAGVLKWLAENELFERVKHISSVSGGSLFTGLVFHFADKNWPTSEHYKNDIYPQIRSLLTSTSLECNALTRLLLNPLNWRFLLSRADVLAKSIKNLWGIDSVLGDLPSSPVWSINGTTAEDGRRFRFKGSTLGDYELGYAVSPGFELASAMAMSAAFPAGIGPLTLKTGEYEWKKRESWGSDKPQKTVMLSFKKLHLYDGGVYDNLGLEPFFNIGKQEIKRQSKYSIDHIVLSDAGAPFQRQGIPGPLHPKRLKRITDVMSEQVRALRVRSFVNFLQNNKSRGMYLQIGSVPEERIEFLIQNTDISVKDLLSMDWLSTSDVGKAKSVATSLKKLSSIEFDLLSRHGYETAHWNDLIWG